MLVAQSTACSRRVSAPYTLRPPIPLTTFCRAPRPPGALHRHYICLIDAYSATHSLRAMRIGLIDPLAFRHFRRAPRPPGALHRHHTRLTDACSATHSPCAAHIRHVDPLASPSLPPSTASPHLHVHYINVTYASLIPAAQPTACTWRRSAM